ncbi:uncharacterized protein LOC120428027 [Culex pipiens pallens]|uniref:uncharacterized protein LOC120428027 n=1 Tax=Culex pipiens pallens TaxID=42434 RepID=UPI0019545977|nr:uncharacterized protein LOC120428027 [Culex pipiens pallens]
MYSCHEDLTQPADKKGKKHAAVAAASGSGEKKPAEKRPAATDSKAAKGGKKFPVSKPNWPKRVLREVLPPKWKKCVIAAGPFETALSKIRTAVKFVGRVLCVCTATAYDIINCPLTTEAVMEKIEDNNTLVFLTHLRANKNHGKKLYSVKLSLGL